MLVLELEKMITIASNKYYNDNPIITDEQFDILYSYLEELASIKKNLISLIHHTEVKKLLIKLMMK